MHINVEVIMQKDYKFRATTSIFTVTRIDKEMNSFILNFAYKNNWRKQTTLPR